LKDVKDDIGQIFVNAFRYNAKNSQVWLDAKRLRVRSNLRVLPFPSHLLTVFSSLPSPTLQKSLKDTYAVMTGEAPPPDEDDIPVTSGGPNSEGDIAVGGDGVLLREGEIPGTKFAKRGATLKPWLTKKLAETTRAVDARCVVLLSPLPLRFPLLTFLSRRSGHSLIEYFRTLPDKRIYADYYRVITNPIGPSALPFLSFLPTPAHAIYLKQPSTTSRPRSTSAVTRTSTSLWPTST
jgi:hypothetical protein